jgi:hypothetical protein
LARDYAVRELPRASCLIDCDQDKNEINSKNETKENEKQSRRGKANRAGQQGLWQEDSKLKVCFACRNISC